MAASAALAGLAPCWTPPAATASVSAPGEWQCGDGQDLSRTPQLSGASALCLLHVGVGVRLRACVLPPAPVMRQAEGTGRESPKWLSALRSLFGGRGAGPQALTLPLRFSGQGGVDGAGAVLPLGSRRRVLLPPLAPNHPADLLLQPCWQGLGQELRGVPRARLR